MGVTLNIKWVHLLAFMMRESLAIFMRPVSEERSVQEYVQVTAQGISGKEFPVISGGGVKDDRCAETGKLVGLMGHPQTVKSEADSSAGSEEGAGGVVVPRGQL